MKMIEKSRSARCRWTATDHFHQSRIKSVVYKTGVMNDPTLTERLYESGATFSTTITHADVPAAEFLLEWILPMAALSCGSGGSCPGK
jgi:cell division protease FtsH